jgi:hypothetical protein
MLGFVEGWAVERLDLQSYYRRRRPKWSLGQSRHSISKWFKIGKKKRDGRRYEARRQGRAMRISYLVAERSPLIATLDEFHTGRVLPYQLLDEWPRSEYRQKGPEKKNWVWSVCEFAEKGLMSWEDRLWAHAQASCAGPITSAEEAVAGASVWWARARGKKKASWSEGSFPVLATV